VAFALRAADARAGEPGPRGRGGGGGGGPGVAGGRDERVAGRAVGAGVVVGVDRPDGAPAARGGRAGRQAHRRGRGRRGGDRAVPRTGAGAGPAAAAGRGLLREPDRGTQGPMKATARAHPNLALVKYWGKRDEGLVLPHQSSLSLTLSPLSVTATVELGAGSGDDEVIINGFHAAGLERERVLALVRRVQNGRPELRGARVETAGDFAVAAG